MVVESPVAGSSLFWLLRRGPLRVTVLGSGNWGTTVARLICENSSSCYLLQDEVIMWVHEAPDTKNSLARIINETHENPLYLPGITLPHNLVAENDLKKAVENADLICFALPHQFVVNVAKMALPFIKPSARGITLVKGLYVDNGKPLTFSQVLTKLLKIPICALSGANVAKDVANKEFCETTIGFDDSETASLWQQVFHTPYFKVSLIQDVEGVQVCGALKNLVALAAGFCDGMQCGSNTKAAIIRIGVAETRAFAITFFEGVCEDTFFDSCGFADVITTSYGGRNVRCAAEFIRRGQKDSWEKIEADLLNGQKMQGNLTCKEVYTVLSQQSLLQKFPLFDITYQIAFEQTPPEKLFENLMASPPAPMRSAGECAVIPRPQSHKSLTS